MQPDPTGALHVAVVGAGEPASFERLIRGLPDQPGFAVVAASPLSLEAVRDASRLPVVSVTERALVEHGRVYVVPTDRQVRLEDGHLVVGARDGAHAPFDAMLRSVADELGTGSIAVVLAGRGDDGALGIRRVKEAGGWTLAQEVSGADGERPRAAISTGHVDLVLPIDEILAQIATRLVGAAPDGDAGSGPAVDHSAPDGGDTLREILALILVRSGHDFRQYKRGTLYRRVAHRMRVCGNDTVPGYHRLLCERPGELDHLVRDFLLSVTQFFRDPDCFEAVARDVVPRLFTERTASDKVRIWIAGCATGEEAYTLGMLLLEHAAQLRSAPEIQIFATDIDERALAVARQGCYPAAIPVDLTQERLRRFFARDGGLYRVHKQLRELVLFSPHNLLRDPPFSRLDLISCRNVLVSLDREAQHRVLTAFHYGLRQDGYLVLGASESVEGSPMFGTVDREHRVYVRRTAPASIRDAGAGPGGWTPAAAASPGALTVRPAGAGELHYRMVERFAPPSVLVSGELDIVHCSANAGRYLEVAAGEPTRQLLHLVHPALRVAVRAAIHAARQSSLAVRRLQFDDDGRTRAVEIRVHAVDAPELGRGAMLVMFSELEPGDDIAQLPATAAAIEPAVRELEDELQRTTDRLRSVVEQYESLLEDTRASNEKLQVMNEEVRSAADELQISREDLQSVNEELTTLNRELQIKVDELRRANSDLQNLMTSTDIGVVFLDRSLRIQRFTPRAQDLFGIISSDIGRPLIHVTHQLDCDQLADIAQSVLDTLRCVEREVHSRDGRCYLARWLPYRSLDDRIDGIVLTFVDVTDVRDAVAARQRSEQALQQVEERLRVALRSAPVAVLGFDAPADAAPGAPVATWGFAMGRELASRERAELTLFAPGHRDRLRASVRQVIAQRAGQRTELDLVIGEAIQTFDFRIEPTACGATAVGFDITPSKRAEAALRDADRRKDEFLATLSHELRNPLAPLQVALDVAHLLDDQPAQRAQSLSIMERQVAMLTTLVNELLDLSRITQGKIVLERTSVRLAHALESAVVATRPMFDAAGHQLRIDLPESPIEVDGDFRRLVQVFTNLLSNAAKYTVAGGHIEVAVIPGDGRVAVRVQDDGVGITSDMLPRIFDIFVQSRDARGRSQGGLGIGLNLVRRLVELHGGTVSATSEGPGRGSAFVVELPLGGGGALA